MWQRSCRSRHHALRTSGPAAIPGRVAGEGDLQMPSKFLQVDISGDTGRKTELGPSNLSSIWENGGVRTPAAGAHRAIAKAIEFLAPDFR